MFHVERLLCCCSGRCSFHSQGAPPSKLPATTLPTMLPSRYPSTISYRPYLPGPPASPPSPTNQLTRLSAPAASKSLPPTPGASKRDVSPSLTVHCSSAEPDTLPSTTRLPQGHSLSVLKPSSECHFRASSYTSSHHRTSPTAAATTSLPSSDRSPPASSSEQFGHDQTSPDCGYSSIDCGGCPVLCYGYPRGAPPSFRSRVASSRPLSLPPPPSIGTGYRSPIPVRAPVPVRASLCVPGAVRGPLPSQHPLLSPLPVRDPLSALPPPVKRTASPACPSGRVMAQGNGRELTAPADDRVTPLYQADTQPCQRTCCSHPYSFPHPGTGHQMAARCRRREGQVRFTSEQSRRLEACFASHKYISPTQRKVLARELDLQERQVMTWFQNRRAKLRRLKVQEEESQRQQQSVD